MTAAPELRPYQVDVIDRVAGCLLLLFGQQQSRIAVMTAILSTLGAVLGYQGGATQNEAMMYKNEAVLKKAQASDQWSFYQAKSNKQNLAELAMAIAPADKQGFYAKEVERYKQEKTDIKKEAEALEAQSKHADELSDAALHPHHRLAQGLTLMQVSISLASITVLHFIALPDSAGSEVLYVSTSDNKIAPARISLLVVYISHPSLTLKFTSNCRLMCTRF
jgi:hypothetical protein